MSRMAPSVKILEQGASRHKQVRRKVDPQKMHVQKKNVTSGSHREDA